MYREQIENYDVKLGNVPNNLTADELKKLGIVVPEDEDKKRKMASTYSYVQNLFFYYHARPEIFKEFERYLNYSALKAKQPIKKMRTFSGEAFL